MTDHQTTATSAGIDIGSTTVKLAVMEGGALVRTKVIGTSSDPLRIAAELLSAYPIEVPIIATGYGRDLLETLRPLSTITEIKAHALGARYLFPSCGTIIDFGGQDLKTITLDMSGSVSRFEMNDRCAAGTGRFLEVMADRLGYTIGDFAEAARVATGSVSISAMCTVFAESEVVGLMNRGCARVEIARALHMSVIRRIVSQLSRVGPIGQIVLTGGGAKSMALHSLLSVALDAPVMVSEHSQCAGAIGAAIAARRGHHA